MVLGVGFKNAVLLYTGSLSFGPPFSLLVHRAVSCFGWRNSLTHGNILMVYGSEPCHGKSDDEALGDMMVDREGGPKNSWE